MKTAMQLMLEDLELKYKVLADAEMIQGCAALEGSIEYANSLIIKEKEQIIDAYRKGFINYLPQTSSEEYYNETYQNTLSQTN